MKYSEAIKLLRKKLLLTQDELAKKLGVSFETVNRWESGRYIPTMKTKRLLAPLFKENNIEVEL